MQRKKVANSHRIVAFALRPTRFCSERKREKANRNSKTEKTTRNSNRLLCKAAV
ncbi:hypothetical protein BDY17DRAFT_17236 [Neohortaea acidophila]|uniref:Uncharacterized protein n=1 Tax=Neohortaea acidophila TaxID=245834 RepID=A0A6A6Q5Z0_9PEZI|nr:uncharacterized protein BDY17DRAFT_17236 [Neohortaea acidophila]KAF2487735.1 hypothetical protein BDY17DRAFT_17236 [Neohortaea acidophila]